ALVLGGQRQLGRARSASRQRRARRGRGVSDARRARRRSLERGAGVVQAAAGRGGARGCSVGLQPPPGLCYSTPTIMLRFGLALVRPLLELGMAWLGGIAEAFADANFRRYSVGSIVSWLSFFVQAVAIAWVTWSLTHSTKWLAIVALLDAAPMSVLAPLGGIV